ncbi:MAG: heparinase II/III family protein [Actinomycetota bacterium]
MSAALAVACAAATLAVGPAADEAAAQGEREVPGFGAPRPRAVYDPGTEAELAARLDRDPYRSIFLDAHALHEARRATRVPGDPDRNAQKDMARAARFLAFGYAIDRTVIDGEIVPFPDEGSRLATGAIVEELLLGLYERSRFAVAPPIGGWDRDIDTAGEILQWSGALDTLLGAAYPFGQTDGEPNDRVIAERLAAVTSELYRNYTDLSTANGVADLHHNNHRSKSGAAMATAAVVLADYADPDEADPSRDPMAWWDYGTTLVDDALRFILVTGDGAYAEGPHYERFTTESIAPYVGMWERVLGDAAWVTAEGRNIPAIHHTTQFALTQDWMLAMTLPNGTLAPIDDANTHEAHFFGALPPLPNGPAYAWRWANSARPYQWEASTDLAVDSIVNFDDSIPAAPPAGSPTSFWPEGGNAVFRSDWSADATMVIAQGEGITASLFGRDAAGQGRAPQSHEHMEPGSYLLHAHGEMLVLDPGYFSFGTRDQLIQARDHNMVLVDGAGPEVMLTNSFAWRSDPFGPPPQDGFATLHSTLDSDRLDSAVVTTSYGAASGAIAIELRRRFLFVDDRYLVIVDDVTPDADEEVTLDWLVHGNGGGTSGGTFAALPNGATWTNGGARLTTAIATTQGPPTLTSRIEEHEDPTRRRGELTHEVQYATVTTDRPVHAVQVLVPSASDGPAPTITTDHDADGTLRFAIADPALGRDVSIEWADGVLDLVDRDSGDDVVVLSTSDTASAGDVELRAPGAGLTALATAPDGWELVADDPHDSLLLRGAGPGRADGGCSDTVEGDRARISPSGSPRVGWSTDSGPTRPGAVIAATAGRAEVGATVRLDGSGSCDIDRSPLTPTWELVSAPRGSDWVLTDTDTWSPQLSVDATGTFRVRLTVVDETGRASDPVEIEIAGGDRCADERDDDLDGLFDAADPDCDGPEPAPPTDTVGILLAVSDATGPYLASVPAPPDTAIVERSIEGAVDAVTMRAGDDGRFIGLTVRRIANTDRAVGLVAAFDPAAGVFELSLWSGRLIEPVPGVIAGIDDAESTIWVVVDEPA